MSKLFLVYKNLCNKYFWTDPYVACGIYLLYIKAMENVYFCSCAGFHVCAAGWFGSGRVGYPIVKAGANCGFGKVGIIDYGYRLNKSEKWDVYCYNPDSEYQH